MFNPTTSRFPVKQRPDEEENVDDEYPRKEIYKFDEVKKWQKSKAFHYYFNFLLQLNKSVKKIDSSYKVCKEKDEHFEKVEQEDVFEEEEKHPLVIKEVYNILLELDKMVDETPLIEKKSLQRYGNPAYRIWFDKMKAQTPKLIQKMLIMCLPQEKSSKSWIWKELYTYFSESFGNRTRIDYGSGHEASFGFFLTSLALLELIPNEETKIKTVTIVFKKYLELVRKIQVKYSLEPAGSHGCWGLDDFQFLPYLFGSSQLIDHERIKPDDILNENIHKEFAGKFLYFDAIRYILDVKTGPFNEHSSILNSLRTCKTWTKINGGMIKMYDAEVLEKFVVVQHFLFGKLMSIEKFQVKK